MLNRVVLVALLAGVALGCDQKWPNNTDSKLNWFPGCSGPIQFFSLTTQDTSGNPEYPISLAKPLDILADFNNPTNVYSSPSLKMTLKLWSWGGWGACQWSEINTLNLLKDLDACSHGIPCPVQTGRAVRKITLDFTKFENIIKLLKNDAPYQLEMILNDSASGDQSCVIAQARALTH